LPVANGGTGETSYTNGQLLIGNTTGNTLTKATLTAGTGVTITNGGGSITIAASGGGGSPGGSTTQLQYNNAGAFGGISGVTTDGTRMTASTTIGVGGATPSTSGSGITFPATASDSTSANTLDDYEEGTWTPTVTNMTTTGSPAYGGMYTKIGRVVTVTFYTTTANGGVATYATTANSTNVAGLPFSANGVIPNAAGGFPGVAINGGTTAGGFLQGPASGTNFYFNSSISATQGISASITYYA
jgi:hypothetical protein